MPITVIKIIVISALAPVILIPNITFRARTLSVTIAMDRPIERTTLSIINTFKEHKCPGKSRDKKYEEKRNNSPDGGHALSKWDDGLKKLAKIHAFILLPP